VDSHPLSDSSSLGIAGDAPADDDDPLDLDLVEVEAGCRLVASGAATAVRLTNLRAPDRIAGAALAIAQANGISFAVLRGDGDGVTFALGPVRPR
jgi:hypothetical protein